jgi:Ser/Thr protein kinase RdoA (MazF antagonist)
MSTLAVRAAPPSASSAAAPVLDEAGADPARVLRFLTEDAPRQVATALAPLVGEASVPLRCTVTRSKLKPGRKLSVWGEVSGPGVPARPYAATWVRGSGRGLPTTAPALVPPQLLGPFTRSATPADAGDPAVAIAPWDPGFPQLVGLYDQGHLARRLVAAGQGAPAGEVDVVPVRYRPGQRHVLRVDVAGRPAFYAKTYRDDTGRRAVTGARQVAAALAAWGGPATVARAAAYLEAELTVLWTAHTGQPLSAVVLDRPELAATAGAALRAVHDSTGVFGTRGDGRSDPAAEVRATERSTEHVAALDPELAGRLAVLLGAAATALDRPGEPGHRLHGDFKADNLLVEGTRLRVLDLDRVTVGDPALDLGKFCADLRWWALAAGTRADTPVAAFLSGYGPAPRERLERARAYDALFQLRAVGRRVLLHEPGWAARVHACLDEAARTLGGGP